AGVASGILIGLGPAARWPVVIGVMAATIAAKPLCDPTFSKPAVSAIAHARGALLVAGLIGRLHPSPFELHELPPVLGFFAVVTVGRLASGILGILGVVLLQRSSASAQIIWLHWSRTDALGSIIVAPLAIAAASLACDAPPRHEVTEGILALSILTILCALL